MHRYNLLYCIFCFFTTPLYGQTDSTTHLSPEERLYSIQNKTKELWQQLHSFENDSLFSLYEQQLDSCKYQFQKRLEDVCIEDNLMQYTFCFSDESFGITLCESEDKQIRIFSRNKLHPGREVTFNSFIQYRINNQSYFKKLRANNMPEVCYYSIQKLQEENQTFYILSGMTQYASLHPVFIIRAIQLEKNEVIPAYLFNENDSKTDQLSINFRDYNQSISSVLFNEHSTVPQIIYSPEEKVIYKPVVIPHPEFDIPYLNGEIELYKWNPKELVFERNGLLP